MKDKTQHGPVFTPAPVAVDAAPVRAVPVVVDPMAAVVARLTLAYPARAKDIARGVTAVGPVVVTAVPVKVPGGWSKETISKHQKYRLVDGTVLPLEC